MDFVGKIVSIRSELVKLNEKGLADEIIEAQLVLGTPGEMLITVCSKLLEIKRRNLDIYKKIEIEAEELIEYSRSVGLWPE